jgi:hypothetical protein
VGERLARLESPSKVRKVRPHRIMQPAVGDDHVENGLRLDRGCQTPMVRRAARRCNIADARPSSDARPSADPQQ